MKYMFKIALHLGAEYCSPSNEPEKLEGRWKKTNCAFSPYFVIAFVHRFLLELDTV